MKNNIVLLLAFLILFMGFFSSVTYTGAFLRESVTGPRYAGSNAAEQDRYYVRTETISMAGKFAGASQSRMVQMMQNDPDFFANGKGDVDGDGDIDIQDKRELELLYARFSHHNSPRGVTRFNQPATDYTDQVRRADMDEDGVLGYQDVKLISAWVQGNGQSQDILRMRQKSLTDCTLEGDTACAEQHVIVCTYDANLQALTWVQMQRPHQNAWCIPGVGNKPARYSAYGPPSLTLYNS